MMTDAITQGAKILSWWERIRQGDISAENLISEIKQIAKIQEVSIEINNQCNLQCKHCYYGFAPDPTNEIPIKEWKRVILEFINLGARLFALAGREPFYNSRSIEILSYLHSLKQTTFPDLRYGVVTNGTLLKNYIHVLPSLEIDYIDVSLEGLSTINDYIRGRGNYQRAINGLELGLKNQIAKKLFVSTTLTSRNYSDIPAFYSDLYDMGIRSFCLSPFFTTSRNLASLFLKEQCLIDFFKHILPGKLKFSSHNEDYQLLLDLNPQSLIYLPLLLKSGIVDLNRIKVDQYGHLYTKENLTDGTAVFFKYSFITDAYWRAVRITYDGYYMGEVGELTIPDYYKRAAGNVMDSSVEQLFAVSLKDRAACHKLIMENIENITTWT